MSNSTNTKLSLKLTDRRTCQIAEILYWSIYRGRWKILAMDFMNKCSFLGFPMEAMNEIFLSIGLAFLEISAFLENWSSRTTNAEQIIFIFIWFTSNLRRTSLQYFDMSQ